MNDGRYVMNPGWPVWLNYFQAINETGDIDPTYPVFAQAPKEIRSKLLVAHLIYYNLGVSARLAEFTDFWGAVESAYPAAKRGAERSRGTCYGTNGHQMISSIKRAFPNPDDFFPGIYHPTYEGVRRKIKEAGLVGFGDYFIWKIVDYMERCLGLEVGTVNAWPHLPSEPKKGASRLKADLGVPGDLKDLVTNVTKTARNTGLRALPFRDRLVNLQEVETFLCGYLHWARGTDYVGKDLIASARELKETPSDPGEELARLLPPPVPLDYFPTYAQLMGTKLTGVFDE
jgi:hypothetical protein